MRIGIDVDEIIADTLTQIIEFHNGTYGTALKRADFRSYNMWEVWGGSEEEAVRKWHEFFETNHFSSINPIAGALPALEILRENGHELFAITARPHIISEQTEDWIRVHYPDLFSGIYFSNRHGLAGIKKKKSELCVELGVTVLIEDDIYHATDCATNGIDVLLFDYPWNQGKLPECVRRVFSWDDVIRMVS